MFLEVFKNNAIQLNHFCPLFADRIFALLVCVQLQFTVAESVYCRYFLHFLRLVGLAVSVAHCFYQLLQLE
jgi:hypothetical protein